MEAELISRIASILQRNAEGEISAGDAIQCINELFDAYSDV